MIRDAVADYLLSDPTPAQRELLAAAESRAAAAAVHLLEHGVESAMNVYNVKPAAVDAADGG